MQSNTRTYLIQFLLFIATIVTTTMAGAEWMHGNIFHFIYDIFGFFASEQTKAEIAQAPTGMGWEEFKGGFAFSIPFLLILTVHEFGHYIVARKRQVDVSLPYYIPLWFGISQSIGTMGAFIRIKTVLRSRLTYFDIGIAGPLAGFVVALAVLWYGFTHLPNPEHIFTIHPEYARFGLNYPQFAYENAVGNIALGDNALFWFFKTYVADPTRLPHAFEMIHYPIIFAGYLALFFTSLNLIPIGQLDGGHILYGMIGKKNFDVVAPTLYALFTFYAGLGLFTHETFATESSAAFYDQMFYLLLYIYLLYMCFSRVFENKTTGLMCSLMMVVAQFAFSYLLPHVEGYTGFLPFAFILGRFLGVKHPPTDLNEKLGTTRMVLGVIALIVFVISFSPQPFIIIE